MLDPLDDPFAKEVVAVPTRGMERWLTQRMSECLGATPGRSDGVCANVDFPSPRRLVNDAVAAASGIEAGEDPWLPERAEDPKPPGRQTRQAEEREARREVRAGGLFAQDGAGRLQAFRRARLGEAVA